MKGVALLRTQYDLQESLAKAFSSVDEQRSPGEQDEGPDMENERKGEEKHALHAAHPSKEGLGKDGKEKRGVRRAKKRKLEAEAGPGGSDEKGVTRKRVRSIPDNSSFTYASTSGEDLKPAEGGWMGSRASVPQEKNRELDELLQKGFKLIEWDGIKPHAILDRSGHVVAVLAGRARGSFDDVLRNATEIFQECSEKLSPPEKVNAELPEKKRSTRGSFHAVVTGVSYGGGQKEPMQTMIPGPYRTTVSALREDASMRRLAGFQNQIFRSYFQATYKYYEDGLNKLYAKYPELQRPFESSVMPAAAFNLGPATVCVPHRDSANVSFGICAITALGTFNPKLGGHIVLKELGVVVEFPPGSSVLIPSAVVTHSNLKIQEGEKRYSFTQYAAGLLFSFVENGMRSNKAVEEDASLSQEEKGRRETERKTRWKKGLDMFPDISDYMTA